MCSIAYFNKEWYDKIKLDEYLELVENRGLDSLWIIHGVHLCKELEPSKPKTKWIFAKSQLIKEQYKKTIETKLERDSKGIMIHLRKASVWANVLENAHPYRSKNSNISLAHNGTVSKEMDYFLKLRLLELGVDSTERSDTKRIFKYIEKSWADNIQDARKLIEFLWKHSSYGIIFIICHKTNIAMIISDGERASVYSIEDKKLQRFCNYNPITCKKKQVSNEWSLVFKFDTWEIISNTLEVSKKKNIESFNLDFCNYKYAWTSYRAYTSPLHPVLPFDNDWEVPPTKNEPKRKHALADKAAPGMILVPSFLDLKFTQRWESELPDFSNSEKMLRNLRKTSKYSMSELRKYYNAWYDSDAMCI